MSRLKLKIMNLFPFLTGTSILAVLLAGYLAQIYLPPPKPKVVGIDLGEFFFKIFNTYMYIYI